MSCSSKSVEERSQSVSLLLKGGSFDPNEKYDAGRIQWNGEGGWKKNRQKKQKRKRVIRKHHLLMSYWLFKTSRL